MKYFKTENAEYSDLIQVDYDFIWEFFKVNSVREYLNMQNHESSNHAMFWPAMWSGMSKLVFSTHWFDYR